MVIRNPFAAREQKTENTQRAETPVYEAPAYVVPQTGAYGVPSINEGSPYNDEFGWGPKLRTSATETPSAQRLQQIPRRDFRPNPVRPPQEFWEPIDRDRRNRHSVETVDADGWTELKGEKRAARDPREIPPPENRPTMKMAPRTYSFTRPFDQTIAREFNGMHFSMADHRRNYEILGMAPIRTSRNTFRIEPVPWDQDIVDLPPHSSYTPDARLRGSEVPAANRSWRL